MTDLSGPHYDAMIEQGKVAAAAQFAWAVKRYLLAHGNSIEAYSAMTDAIIDISTQMTMYSVQPKVLGEDIPFSGNSFIAALDSRLPVKSVFEPETSCVAEETPVIVNLFD